MKVVRLAVVVVVALSWATTRAAADEWNDKTILTISQPMIVPGATLPAGTYSFELADANSSRHLVAIYRQPDHTLITTAPAVPMKRPTPKGDIVLKLQPTQAGLPPAIGGWFYPGSIYGHQFIYPEAQAREIAQRTKTLVLSTDVPGTDLEKGVIHVVNADGVRQDWRNDDTTEREWNQWITTRRARGTAAAPSDAQTTLVQDHPAGARVSLDDVEHHPDRYSSQLISVDGVVQDVLGPRLFTIDEPSWTDPQREVVVFMPTSLAALVREGDRVTVTGAMRPYSPQMLAGETVFATAGRDANIAKHPLMIGSGLVGGDNHTALIIGSQPAAIGTSGTARRLERPDRSSVGTHVHLDAARVRGTAAHGFFVESGGTTLFVLPANQNSVAPSTGRTMVIDGVVLQMPAHAPVIIGAPAGVNTDIYILADSIE